MANLEVLHQEGVSIIYFPGREVPSWFNHKSKASSISFTVPSHPKFKIQGLNVCFVYTCRSIDNWNKVHFPLVTKINNKTKRLKWSLFPHFFGIPNDDEDMISLSHLKIGKYLEGSDEVSISVIVSDRCQMKEFGIKEVGIDIVWEQEENVGTPQKDKWCHINDIGDESDFSRYIEGMYFEPSPMVDDSLSLVEEEDMNTSESGTNGLQHSNGIWKVLITSTVFVLSLALVPFNFITFQRKRRTKSQHKK